MKIIEFIGAPCTGKSYAYNLIVNKVKKKNIFSYKSAFFKYIFKENLNFFEYLVLLYFKYTKLKKIKKEVKEKKISLINSQSINKNIFFLSNYLYLSYINICKKFSAKCNFKIRDDIFKIINLHSKMIDNKNRNSKKWFIEFFAYMYIVKKYQKNINLIIDDEGFFQKLFVFSDLKFDKNFIKKFLHFNKTVSVIINIKSPKKEVLARSNLRSKSKFKYKNFKHLNKVLNYEKKVIQILKNNKNFFQFANNNKLENNIDKFIKKKI